MKQERKLTALGHVLTGKTFDEKLEQIIHSTQPSFSRYGDFEAEADLSEAEAIAAIKQLIRENLPEKNQSIDDTGLDRDLDDFDRGWNAALDVLREVLVGEANE